MSGGEADPDARRGGGPVARGGAAARRREHEEDGSSLGAPGRGSRIRPGGADPDGAEERQRWRRPRRGWARRPCPQGFFFYLINRGRQATTSGNVLFTVMVRRRQLPEMRRLNFFARLG
jgi:hypothetical protein